MERMKTSAEEAAERIVVSNGVRSGIIHVREWDRDRLPGAEKRRSRSREREILKILRRHRLFKLNPWKSYLTKRRQRLPSTGSLYPMRLSPRKRRHETVAFWRLELCPLNPLGGAVEVGVNKLRNNQRTCVFMDFFEQSQTFNSGLLRLIKKCEKHATRNLG